MSLLVIEKCLITTGQKYNLSVQQTSNVLIKYVNNDYKEKILKIKDKYQKLLENKTISAILNGELNKDIVKAMLMKLDEGEVRMMCQMNDYMKNIICIDSFWILYFENKFKDKTKTEMFLHLLERDQTEKIALIIYKKYKNDIDVNVKDKEAIVWASKYGNHEVVKVLLKDERVDPSDYDNFAIGLASKYGHFDVVKELLEDERVDPSDDDNYAIILASENGHLDVVKELLKDKRVDPGDWDNHAIILASENGHLDVVKELLKDDPKGRGLPRKRVDPSDGDNWAIISASKNGHLEVVKKLLKDKRVDPSDLDNFAIRWASQNGHLDVVKELLKDDPKGRGLPRKRVDPSDWNNKAIGWASENGHLEVVKILLKDKRVKNSLSDDKIKEYQEMLK